MVKFATLYSGSSGNSAVLAQENGFLLVDMGGNCKKTLLALQELELDPRRLRGVLVTHEHSDHIGGLKVFLKKYPVPVYGGVATLEALESMQVVPPQAQLVPIDGRCEDVADFEVMAFPTSHDSAGCCGFILRCANGKQMSIATDLGVVSNEVYGCLRGSELVALEANYDRVMLQMGPYPYYLKTRIASPRGHLCNDDTADTLSRLAGEGCRRFALCHLSRENNTPELAADTVRTRLREDGRFSVQELMTGGCLLQVSPRYTISPWIEF